MRSVFSEDSCSGSVPQVVVVDQDELLLRFESDDRETVMGLNASLQPADGVEQ
jgi:hypothetical protein